MIVVLAADLLEAIGGTDTIASGETGIGATASPMLNAVTELATVSPGLGPDGARRFLTGLREGRMLTVPAYRADEVVLAVGTGDLHPAFALRDLPHLPTTFDDAQEMASINLGGKENAEPGSIKQLADKLHGFARGLLADARAEWELTPGGQEHIERQRCDSAKVKAQRQAASRAKTAVAS